MSNPELELRLLVVGGFQENCYLLVEPETNAAILIDPGAEAGRVLAWLEGSAVRLILLTHAHLDHIGALAEVRAALDVRVGLHPADNALAAEHNISPDFALADGVAVQLGPHDLMVVHTPGHSPGHVCLRFDTRAIVGDAIFPGGPGHTNTPDELSVSLDSLQHTVFTWPDETALYPGHGRGTTVGQERPGFDKLLAKPLPPDLHGDVTWASPPEEK